MSFAMILSSIAVSVQASGSSEYAAFDAFLAGYRKEKRIPAMAAAIVKDGKVVWEAAYGNADDEGALRATPDTVFYIASVTKPIAATAILQEVASGRLSLQLPTSADKEWQETCQWLSTSEIPFGAGGTEADGTPIPAMDCSRQFTLGDVLNMRLNGKSGTSFVYNPISYARIDRAIAGSGGRPLRSIVRDNVAAKAGMKDTALGWHDPDGGAALRLLAPPFAQTKNGPRKAPFPDDDFRAADGIYTSVRQLAKFDIAFSSGALLPPEWQKRVMDGWRTSPGYSFGWFNQTWNGHRLMWHSGWSPDAYSAIYLKVPDEGLTLLVLANTEALWWNNSLVRAEIEKSPVAEQFLTRVVRPRGPRPSEPPRWAHQGTSAFHPFQTFLRRSEFDPLRTFAAQVGSIGRAP
jgi:CubicO group peptidase (beta-lactamase class C family)